MAVVMLTAFEVIVNNIILHITLLYGIQQNPMESSGIHGMPWNPPDSIGFHAD